MLNIAYTHAIVVLVIFHSYMVQSEQSNSHSLYSITSVVVLFAYPIKLNMLTKNGVTKILLIKGVILLSYLIFSIQNLPIQMLDKISFHKHFKID